MLCRLSVGARIARSAFQPSHSIFHPQIHVRAAARVMRRSFSAVAQSQQRKNNQQQHVDDVVADDEEVDNNSSSKLQSTTSVMPDGSEMPSEAAILEGFPPSVAKLLLMYRDLWTNEGIPYEKLASIWNEKDAYEHKKQLKDEVYQLLVKSKTELAKTILDAYVSKYIEVEENMNLRSKKSNQHLLVDAVLMGYYGQCLRQIVGEADNSIGALELSLEFFDELASPEKRPRDESDEKQVAHCTNDAERAAEESKRRKQVNKILYMVCSGLGTLYFNRDDYKTAHIYLKRALEVHPSDEHCLFMCALIGEYLMDYDTAEQYYKLLEQYHGENNASLLGDIACFYKNCKKDFSTAEQKLQQALRINPKHSNNLYNMAVLYMNGFKDAEKAEEYFLKTIEQDKEHSAALAKYGALLLLRGEYERARGMLKRSISFDPFQTESLCNLAYTEQQLGHFPEAEELYKRALKQAEDDDAARAHKDRVKRDREQGISTHDDQGASPLPVQELGSEQFDMSQLYLNYANLLYELKKYKKAEDYYRKAIDLVPDNISAMGNLALLLDTLDKDMAATKKAYQQAISTFERKLQSLTNDDEKRVLLATFGVSHKNNLGNFANWLLEKEDVQGAKDCYAKIMDLVDKFEVPLLGEELVAAQLVQGGNDFFSEYAKLIKQSDPQQAAKLKERSKHLKALGKNATVLSATAVVEQVKPQ